MLIVNGKKYANTDKEFTGSLFDKSGTCSGFYKVNKGGIVLMDMQKTVFAFIVNNKHNEQFFVSAIRQADKKIRYMYALADSDADNLGVKNMGYIQGRECAKMAIESLNHNLQNNAE